MKLLSAAALLLLCRCGGGGVTSPCGTAYPEEVNAATVALREAQILAAFETHAHWNPAVACGIIGQYTVTHRGTVFGFAPPPGASDTVRWGNTKCRDKVIEIAPGWDYFVLPHELAHAVEACSDPLHERWEQNGVWAAIHSVTL